MKLRVHRLAVAEIDYEGDYYESRSVGLGAELEDEIDAALETILQFPRAAPQWRDRLDRRVAPLDRFPFTLVYQIKLDEISQDHLDLLDWKTGIALLPASRTTRNRGTTSPSSAAGWSRRC